MGSGGQEDRRPAKRVVRCPICKGVELSLTESIECFGHFQQHADGTVDVEGYNTEGGYFKVMARCETCAHSWRVRGVRQITDIRDDDG